MAVSFQCGADTSVNAVSVFLTPTGTEAFSYRKQLAVQAVDANQGIALFFLDIAPDIIGHLNVTLECDGGQTVTQLLNVVNLD